MLLQKLPPDDLHIVRKLELVLGIDILRRHILGEEGKCVPDPLLGLEVVVDLVGFEEPVDQPEERVDFHCRWDAFLV